MASVGTLLCVKEENKTTLGDFGYSEQNKNPSFRN